MGCHIYIYKVFKPSLGEKDYYNLYKEEYNQLGKDYFKSLRREKEILPKRPWYKGKYSFLNMIENNNKLLKNIPGPNTPSIIFRRYNPRKHKHLKNYVLDFNCIEHPGNDLKRKKVQFLMFYDIYAPWFRCPPFSYGLEIFKQKDFAVYMDKLMNYDFPCNYSKKHKISLKEMVKKQIKTDGCCSYDTCINHGMNKSTKKTFLGLFDEKTMMVNLG